MTDRLPHHEGLPEQGLRDYIGRMMAEDSMGFGVGFCATARDKFRDHLVAEVEKAKAALEGFDTGKALHRVATSMGWNAFDVSDFVNYDKDTYQCFVGTESELLKVYPSADGEQRE